MEGYPSNDPASTQTGVQMKRFALLLILFTFASVAHAQFFKRNSNSCQNGSCQLYPTTSTPVPTPVPAPEPIMGTKGVGEDFPTGVNSEAISKGYHLNGVKVTKQEAYSALENALPEFSKKWRLVVVGTTDQRKEVLAKIGTKDSVVVNCFPPDHFYVKDMKPNTLITLMKPTGEVVADGGLADVDKVMDFTKVGPFDAPVIPPKPDVTPPVTPPVKPLVVPTPDPVTPTPWYSPLNWVHLVFAGVGIVLAYVFPWMKNFLASKIGGVAEAEVEALVESKLASYLAKIPVPQPPVSPAVSKIARGWK